MTRYGLRTFVRDGTPYVEGLDGTQVPIWKAIEERTIGQVFLRRREISFLQFAEEYHVQTST